MDIVRSQAKVRIVQIELGDAADVGRDTDMIVRDTHGRPDTADFTGAGAYDFKVPDFFGIDEGEAFTAVAVAVFLDEFADEFDGVAAVGGAFQGEPFEFFDREDSFATFATGDTTILCT